MSTRVPKHSCLVFVLTSVFLWLSCADERSQADVEMRTVAPGVILTQEITTGSAPLVVTILRVDLHAPGVAVACGQAHDAITLQGASLGREPLQTIASRHHAVAAINADFFPFTGDPLGLAIRDGELLSEPTPYRACIGFGRDGVQMAILSFAGKLNLRDGTELAVNGVNRVPHQGDTIALTPSYQATPRLDAPAVVLTLAGAKLPLRPSENRQESIQKITILSAGERLPACPTDSVMVVSCGPTAPLLEAHSKPGDACFLRFDLLDATSKSPQPEPRSTHDTTPSGLWANIDQAVGGGPWLVRNGQVSVDGSEERFSAVDFVNKRHPRSAAGVTEEGVLLLVTVDGRQARSQGATLPELAAIMKRLGAVNALNLDGGGSSTLVAQDDIVNAPSDGKARPIADGLLIFADHGDTAGAAIAPTIVNAMSPTRLHAGEEIRLQVSGTPLPTRVEESKVLWGTQDGFGFVSQKGVFASYQSGDGFVTARLGDRVETFPIHVTASQPALLAARLSVLPGSGTDQSRVTLTLLDRFRNPVRSQRLQVTIEGGHLESPLLTDSNGKVTADITWTAPISQRSLTAAFGTLRTPTLTWNDVKSESKPSVPMDPDNRP